MTDMTDFASLVKERHSCRRFEKGKPIPREELDACLALARLSPSACNSQPWRFLVVDTPDGIAALAPSVQDRSMNAFASDAAALIAVLEEPAHLLPKLFDTDAPNQSFAQIDIGIAVAHLTLALAERGIGTCIMGWINQPRAHEALALPESVPIRLVIAAGYPSAEDRPREKRRKSLDDVRIYQK